jgi:hypothetical protein
LRTDVDLGRFRRKIDHEATILPLLRSFPSAPPGADGLGKW